MKLRFLGTGAAGSMKRSESEMIEGQRRCSSLLIDGVFVVDLSPQSIDYADKLGVDTTAVTDVFLTHSHCDHYKKTMLLSLAKKTKKKLNFWCHKGAIDALKLDDEEKELINLCPVEVMDKWETGGAKITALAANHIVEGSPEQPLHYIFEKDRKSLFYGCDGGWFVARTWEYMRKIKLDAIILDATVGDDAGNFRIGTHNTFPMLKLINSALFDNKIMDESGVRIANHIAPSVYDMDEVQIKELFASIGMITAVDGLELEF